MKAITTALVLLAALAVEAQTNELIPVLVCGEQSYTNARITQTSPAYAVISHEGGVAQVAMSNLPVAYQQQYGYSPADAEKFLAEKKRKEEEARRRQAAYEKAAAAMAGPEETVELTAILDETSYGGIPLCAGRRSGHGQGQGKMLVKNMPGPVSNYLHQYQKLKADVEAEETTPITVTAQATRNGSGHAQKAADKAANRALKEAKAERKVQLKHQNKQLSDMEKSLKENASIRAYPTGQSWSGYEIWVCTGTP
ncbi:MAG TPA: hypothetical protein VMB80_11255 [Candidatus Acidoferrum sp.]|nr:hypothetical protein [Candidatus Acidoferrum sp.]